MRFNAFQRIKSRQKRIRIGRVTSQSWPDNLWISEVGLGKEVGFPRGFVGLHPGDRRKSILGGIRIDVMPLILLAG